MNDARSGEDFSAQMKRLRESHAQHVEHAIAQGDAYKAPTFEGDEDQLNRLSMMHSRTQGLYNEAAYDAERKGPDAEMRTRQKRAQDLRKVMIEQEHALNVAKRKAEGRDDSIKAGRAAEEAGQGSLFKAVVDTILKAVGTQAGYWRTSPKGTQYFVPAHSRALPDRPAILQTADRNASRSTADLERKYGGRHKEQFIMQHPDTKENFLVRRFGSPAKSGYAIHDKTGKLAGTLHVSHKADHAHVTNGWTAPEHSGKQLHRPLLRALSGRHGAVLSPAAMSDDLHSSFSGMAKHGHRIGIHRSEKSGGARYLVAQDNPTLF
jgi:hypothetical protein